MNARFLLSALVLAAMPLAGFAQQPPPPPAFGGPPITAQQRQALQSFMEQAQKLHEQARAQMLAALTPEHKQLLATIAGQLAVSPNPDPSAAAEKLDAALSPQEKQGILKADDALHEQLKNLHQQMAARLPHPMFRRNQDPGMLLLMPEGGIHIQIRKLGGGPMMQP
jgi:hypothetical protein